MLLNETGSYQNTKKSSTLEMWFLTVTVFQLQKFEL